MVNNLIVQTLSPKQLTYLNFTTLTIFHLAIAFYVMVNNILNSFKNILY